MVIGTAPLRATAAACAAVLAAAADDHQTARRRFEDAVELAERARLPYKAARARMGLASALGALGRTDEARDEVAGRIPLASTPVPSCSGLQQNDAGRPLAKGRHGAAGRRCRGRPRQ